MLSTAPSLFVGERVAVPGLGSGQAGGPRSVVLPWEKWADWVRVWWGLLGVVSLLGLGEWLEEESDPVGS
jgi:hypothetical protein